LRSSAIFPILFKIDIKGAEVDAASALSPQLKCTAGIARHTRAAVAAIKRGAHGNETNIWLRAALSPSADAVRAVSNLPIRIYPSLHPRQSFSFNRILWTHCRAWH
jgi:hypothetical protein